ncbi:LysR family transcriptional regulator [Vibrio sp. LaRot3]|uniref:LysR family transcriptional regulator n=1 Tax=Vibrio sp. LaRot3 TaxID=2998829 RepID=UPI0022CE1870|nr:LysR family transcriptional regulator [Vibrio sp. LaRot3]MDA0148240.1 LysR family transcriptional regulator [Vibrio sp. LaRot3]
MNIEHLKLFVRLSKTHNISMAGQELGISPAVASAHINKLEEGLGVRLVHRTTRKVSLTEEGEAFLPHAEEVLASVDAARDAIGVGDSQPTGTLRVAAPAAFGRLHLMPALKGFMDLYPKLTVDFRFSDSVVDMIEGGFDIAIRNAELKDSTLIARKLTSDHRFVCASPEYLKQHGEPQHPKDLANHHCLSLMGMDVWDFYDKGEKLSVKTSGPFRTDNADAMREAAINGLGLTVIPAWFAYKKVKQGQLALVLRDYPLASDTAIWAVYPSSRMVAPKVRAFIDYFVDYYGNPAYWCKELAAHKAQLEQKESQ